MKYEIFINGGFANIPKQYEGEIALKKEQQNQLIETLSKKLKPSEEIFDGFVYHIRIADGDLAVKSVYDEHNLPKTVREFIDTVLQNKI